MKIAICDDELEYRSYLEELVNFYFHEKNIEISRSTYECGEDLIKANTHYDILLLDIEMNGINGIETAMQINKKYNNTIIFVITAYQKYLDEAMDLNVFRYIDKPVNAQRLYIGFDKAIEYLNNNSITFKTRNDGIIKIKKTDILYVEVSIKKVCVITKSQKIISREKFDYFKNNLVGDIFICPHNSYIVNMREIVKLKRNELQVSNGDIIAIAPKKQVSTKKSFMNFMGEDNGSISDDF